MQQLSLVASNNQSFALSLDCTQVAAVYPLLNTFVFRLQIKTYPTDPTPLVEFATSGAEGVVYFNASSNVAQFLAPQFAVAAIYGLKYFDIRVEAASIGEFVIAYGEIEFAAGPTISSSSPNNVAAASLADTVTVVNSSVLSLPGVLPVSPATLAAIFTNASASLAAATAAETAAAASYASLVSEAATAVPAVNSASSASVSAINGAASTAVTNIGSAQSTAVAAVIAAAATYSAFTQAQFISWLNGLPTTLPASSGQWWVDNGVLSQS